MPAVSAMPASFAIEMFVILVSPNYITTEISGFMPVTLAGSRTFRDPLQPNKFFFPSNP